MFDDKNERNCGFTDGNDRFRYRAGAIIVEDGYTLLATNDAADYYYSIGGAVHLGETSEEAVLREVFEETGVHYEIDRLAFVFENFYRDTSKSVLSGYDGHEISFFYLMKPRGTRSVNSDSVCVDGKEYVKWLPIDRLGEYKVFPQFFAQKLKAMPTAIEHIVNDERRNKN
ncbi:MAG: NUDIX domain-containing protein [Roseburia sp.]|nr:NUDIX domain-containing protein [Roseburia sp.]